MAGERLDLTAMHRSEMEAIVVDNAKLLERYRRGIANIVREMEDEGDRVYLGSTNDADELRELEEKLNNSLNYLACKHMHGRDLYADLRALRKTNSALAAAMDEALPVLAQIPLDFKYPPAPDSVERRIERADALADKINAILAKIGGAV